MRTPQLPDSNHIFWIILVVGLLILSDTLTSWLFYNNGYDLSKDSSKTMAIVTTVLVPLLLQRWKGNSQ